MVGACSLEPSLQAILPRSGRANAGKTQVGPIHPMWAGVYKPPQLKSRKRAVSKRRKVRGLSREATKIPCKCGEEQKKKMLQENNPSKRVSGPSNYPKKEVTPCCWRTSNHV